jgi:hypothetical protein
MDKELNEVKRGEQAAQVLENPLFKESVEKVREGIIKSMATSPLGDDTTHNRLVIALQLLNQIEKQLIDVMATGKMAAIQTDNKFKLFR